MHPIALIFAIVGALLALLNLLRAVFHFELPYRPAYGWFVALGVLLVAFALFLWGPLSGYLSSDFVRVGVFLAVCSAIFYVMALLWRPPIREALSRRIWPWITLLVAITFLIFTLVWQSLSLNSVKKESSNNLERLALTVAALRTPSMQLATMQAESTRTNLGISQAQATQTVQALEVTSLEDKLSAVSTAIHGVYAASTAQAIAIENARATIEAQAITISGAQATIQAQGTALAVVQAGGIGSGSGAPSCSFDALVTELSAAPSGVADVVSGQRILRIWSIKNSGSCTWSRDVAWVFTPDTPGLTVQLKRWNIGRELLPGQEFLVDELLIAPDETGEYRGHWQMVDSLGKSFGASFPIRVLVSAEPILPTPVAGCKPAMFFVEDASYPDRAVTPRLPVEKRFHKAWLVSNPRGACPWTEDYKLVQVGGDSFGITQQAVPKTAPGRSTYLVLEMVTPTTPGFYKSSWKMQDPSGRQFGDEVWMEIAVE